MPSWPAMIVIVVALGACDTRSREAPLAAVSVPGPAATFAVLPSSWASRKPALPQAPLDAGLDPEREQTPVDPRWLKANRAAVWGLIESLPLRVSQIEDLGCGDSFKPDAAVGPPLARLRQVARRSGHYHERLVCFAPAGAAPYECHAAFGETDSGGDYTWAVTLSVLADATLAKAPIRCGLFG